MAEKLDVPVKLHLTATQDGALRAIRDSEGVPVSEQIRRGVDLWLAERAAVPFGAPAKGVES